MAYYMRPRDKCTHKKRARAADAAAAPPQTQERLRCIFLAQAPDGGVR